MKTFVLILPLLTVACASTPVPSNQFNDVVIPLENSVSKYDVLFNFRKQETQASLSILRNCEIETFSLVNTKDDVSLMNVRTMRFAHYTKEYQSIINRDNKLYVKTSTDLLDKNSFLSAQIDALYELDQELIQSNVVCQSRLRVLRDRIISSQKPKSSIRRVIYSTIEEEEEP